MVHGSYLKNRKKRFVNAINSSHSDRLSLNYPDNLLKRQIQTVFNNTNKINTLESFVSLRKTFLRFRAPVNKTSTDKNPYLLD